MLSGYGNLNNQFKDPINNNKDCRVGQLNTIVPYLSAGKRPLQFSVHLRYHFSVVSVIARPLFSFSAVAI